MTFHFFKKDFIDLFMRDTDTEAETYVEGGAGTMQRAWCETRSQDPRDHNLNQRQLLNHCTTQVPLNPDLVWFQTHAICTTLRLAQNGKMVSLTGCGILDKSVYPSGFSIPLG